MIGNDALPLRCQSANVSSRHPEPDDVARDLFGGIDDYEQQHDVEIQFVVRSYIHISVVDFITRMLEIRYPAYRCCNDPGEAATYLIRLSSLDPILMLLSRRVRLVIPCGSLA